MRTYFSTLRIRNNLFLGEQKKIKTYHTKYISLDLYFWYLCTRSWFIDPRSTVHSSQRNPRTLIATWFICCGGYTLSKECSLFFGIRAWPTLVVFQPNRPVKNFLNCNYRVYIIQTKGKLIGCLDKKSRQWLGVSFLFLIF